VEKGNFKGPTGGGPKICREKPLGPTKKKGFFFLVGGPGGGGGGNDKNPPHKISRGPVAKKKKKNKFLGGNPTPKKKKNDTGPRVWVVEKKKHAKGAETTKRRDKGGTPGGVVFGLFWGLVVPKTHQRNPGGGGYKNQTKKWGLWGFVAKTRPNHGKKKKTKKTKKKCGWGWGGGGAKHHKGFCSTKKKKKKPLPNKKL